MTAAVAASGGARTSDLATVAEENEGEVVDLTPGPPPAPWWSFFDCCRFLEEGQEGSRHSAFQYYSHDDKDIDVIIKSSSSPPRSPPRAISAPPVYTEGSGENAAGRPGVGAVRFTHTQYDATDTIGGPTSYRYRSPQRHHPGNNASSPGRNGKHEHGGRHHRAGSINSASHELIESLEAELCQCRKNSASKSRELERLQTELGSVKKILAATVREKNEISAEREILQNEAEDHAVKVEAMQKEMERLLNCVAETTAAHSTEVEALQKDLQRSMSMKEEASASKIDDLQKELVGVRSSLTDTACVRDGLARENMELQREAELMRGKLLDASIAKEKISSDAEVEISNLQLELELAKEQLEEANEKNQFLIIELEDAKEDACRAQEELASKVKSLEANLLHSKNESVGKGLEAKSLRKQLENARNSLDETVTKMDHAMQQNISSITLEMDEVMAAKASISSEVEALQKELETVRKSLDGAIADKDRLSIAYEMLQKEVSSIAADRDRLMAERASPLQKVGPNAPTSLEVETLQLELKSVRHSLDEATAYKEQLATFKGNMLKKISSLKTERDQLLAERETMQQQIESLLSKVAEMQLTVVRNGPPATPTASKLVV